MTTHEAHLFSAQCHLISLRKAKHTNQKLALLELGMNHVEWAAQEYGESHTDHDAKAIALGEKLGTAAGPIVCQMYRDAQSAS